MSAFEVWVWIVGMFAYLSFMLSAVLIATIGPNAASTKAAWQQTGVLALAYVVLLIVYLATTG